MKTATASAWLPLPTILALVLLAGASTAALGGPAALDERKERALISVANAAPEKTLAGLPGMTPEAAAKVIAHRKSGKTIASVDEFRKVAGLDDEQFDRLAAHFSKGVIKKDEASVPGEEFGVLPEPSRAAAVARSKSGQREEAGAPRRSLGAKGQAKGGAEPLDLEVRPNFYMALPGYDFSKVPVDKRDRFLDVINTEMCPCGCDHTLAACLVNHEECPVVKPMVRKIYTDIVGEPPAPPPASDPNKP